MAIIYIITLNWNGKDKLQNLWPSLYSNINFTKKEAIWYIRDNGSKDGSVEWINKDLIREREVDRILGDSFSTKIPVVVKEINHNRDNFAQGMNSLFEDFKDKITNKDFILLLNNDIKFANDTSLKSMLELMKDPKVAVVGARLLYPDSDILQHAGVIFSNRYNKNPFHYLHKQKSNKNAENNRFFQAVTAACCLVRADVFAEVGGFDTNLRWCFDDIDLCLKIREKGYKIAYCGKTKIFHEESASLKKNNVHLLSMNHNVQYFKQKWLGKYDLDLEKYEKDPDYMVIDGY